MNWLKRFFRAPDTRRYGGDGTIHQTGIVNVETDENGNVVSVWFRCLALPFDQTFVGERRASEMRSMYASNQMPQVVAIETKNEAT